VARYTLVKGNYWIHYPDRPRQGPQPDGDTVTFHPDNPQLVRDLPWFSHVGPGFNARGNIPVRYEGIDALETHFQGAHQQLQFADAARDLNLQLLGFTNVSFFDDLPNVVESVDVNPMPGYVIANGIESNGRLLGQVYAGTTQEADGTNIFLDAARLNQSVNSQLVMAGLAYVEPYDTMPLTLVQNMRQVIATARQNQAGFFPSEDVSLTSGASISDLDELQPQG
jgi:endonuclease YncB( thermonuclease family)